MSVDPCGKNHFGDDPMPLHVEHGRQDRLWPTKQDHAGMLLGEDHDVGGIAQRMRPYDRMMLRHGSHKQGFTPWRQSFATASIAVMKENTSAQNLYVS